MIMMKKKQAIIIESSDGKRANDNHCWDHERAARSMTVFIMWKIIHNRSIIINILINNNDI